MVQQPDVLYNVVKIKDGRSLTVMTVSHGIRLDYDKVEVEVNGKMLEAMKAQVTDREALEELIKKVDRLKLCEGPGCGQHAANCPGWVIGKAMRCFHCKGRRAADMKSKRRESLTAIKTKNLSPKIKQKLQNLKRSKERILQSKLSNI